MRSVYALLGLVKKWGADRVEAACAGALEHEVVNIALIGRMLDRGREGTTLQPALPGTVIAARFARDPAEFAVERQKHPHPPIDPDPARPSEGNVEDGLSADRAGGVR